MGLSKSAQKKEKMIEPSLLHEYSLNKNRPPHSVWAGDCRARVATSGGMRTGTGSQLYE